MPQCSRQNDPILRIPRTKLSTRHDHQTLQANDRDKDSRREEVQKDFASRQRLQPNCPNVVRQNTCLSTTDSIEGGKSQECWQYNLLRRTDQHTDPRQTDHGGAKRRSQILPDPKSRAPKSSQRAQEGTPARLSH
jgi:hypothetical protein